jgi:hypothetical protein
MDKEDGRIYYSVTIEKQEEVGERVDKLYQSTTKGYWAASSVETNSLTRETSASSTKATGKRVNVSSVHCKKERSQHMYKCTIS